MQPFGATRPGGHRPNALPDGLIASRHLRQAGQDGPEVEERSAHENGPTTSAGDVLEDRSRSYGEGGGVAFLIGVEDVDQVVRHTGALVRVRLGAADVEPAVDLYRVEVDD